MTERVFAHIMESMYKGRRSFRPKGKGARTLKGKPGLRLLLALFALTFACVLLSGAGRLLRTQAQQAPESLPALVSLTAPAAREAVESVSAASQKSLRRAPEGEAPQEQPASAPRALTDANGNVLRGMSYLRTVYSAFALGDGFA